MAAEGEYKKLKASKIKVDLKPWRIAQLQALAGLDEGDASCLVNLHDFPVEDYMHVRLQDLVDDTKIHVDIMRASEAAERAKLQAQHEGDVLSILVDAFENDDIELVSLERSVVGELMSEDNGYYSGRESDFGDEHPHTSLEADYVVKFRIGGKDAPVAKLKFQLDIDYEIEFSDDKFYVNDLIHNETHDAHCFESVSRDYPGLPGPSATSMPGQTCKDRITKLLEDIAIAVGVQDWVIHEHTSMKVTSAEPVATVKTDLPATEPPAAVGIVEITVDDE